MELLHIEALFFVPAESWTEDLQRFIAERVEPEYRRWIRDFTKAFQCIELPTFLDRAAVKGSSLGVMRFQQGIDLDDYDISVHVMTELWHPRGFLLRLRVNPANLERLTDEQRTVVQDNFGRSVREVFRHSVSKPPRFVGEITTFTEPLLNKVRDSQALQDFCKGIDVSSRDIFWKQGDHSVVFLMDLSVIDAASHSVIAADEGAADSIVLEMEKFRWYVGTRSLEDMIVTEAEDEAKRALSFRSSIQKARTDSSLLTLLASLHPKYRDSFGQVNTGIAAINNATQRLATLKTDLNGLSQVYESSLWGRGGQLAFAEFHLLRGHLISVQDEDMGSLTLTAYMRRSALNILSFYVQRIDASIADLNALLSALQTMASVKSAEQAEILNRLILILTVASVELALLQVTSATTLWKGFSPIVLALVLMALNTVAVVWAFQAVQKERSRPE